MTEQEMWAQKDRRIVAQNALSHATQIVLAKSTGLDNRDTIVKEITAIAQQFVDFVYQVGEQKPVKTVPTPTLEQNEWLDKIQKQFATTLTVEELKAKALALLGRYPSNKEDATVLYRQLKGK